MRLGFSPHERLLILDTWQRSGLPAGDFAPLVGLSKHTVYLWKKRFAEHGPAGLTEQPRGARTGSKLSEVTRRTIVLLKEAHPEWGCQRISDELARGPAMAASPGAVARALHEAGYQLEERVTRPHPDKVRRFERARPNQHWQTDLFTFVLKRQNRRLHLVGFSDDHSRFVVGYGLHASASSALVLEVLRAAIASYGPPEEILTDNGPQYVIWRGKSQFSRELEQQGIRQVISRPKHAQTLGKVERFWGTLWRECLQRAVFLDLEDTRATDRSVHRSLQLPTSPSGVGRSDSGRSLLSGRAHGVGHAQGTYRGQLTRVGSSWRTACAVLHDRPRGGSAL